MSHFGGEAAGKLHEVLILQDSIKKGPTQKPAQCDKLRRLL
jgi:hypothetical protein